MVNSFTFIEVKRAFGSTPNSNIEPGISELILLMTFSLLYGASHLTCFNYRANSGKLFGGRMVRYSSPRVHQLLF